MTGKRLLLFLCGLILIPLLAFAAFLAAGTVIPIGTFNPVERQKLEAKFQEKLKASKFEQRKAQIVTEERRTAQTKGGVAQRKGQSSKSPLNKRLPVSKTKPQFAKQPAVGGGIGPADADVIIGINTAGTVHVNRFA